MFWDELVRRWRRDTGQMTPRLLRGAAGHVAVLPAPRPRRRLRLSLLILVAVGLATIALLLEGGRVDAALLTSVSYWILPRPSPDTPPPPWDRHRHGHLGEASRGSHRNSVEANLQPCPLGEHVSSDAGSCADPGIAPLDASAHPLL